MPPFSRGKGLVIVKWNPGTNLSDSLATHAYRAGKGCSSEPCGEDERHNRYGFAPIDFLVLKKIPKSAMKKGGGKKKRKSPKKTHKFQNEIEWWNNPNIILPLSMSLIAGGYAALVWIDNKLAEREGKEKKKMKERRKTARKALLKNTNIPQVIIDEITNEYLFSELDKKYSK